MTTEAGRAVIYIGGTPAAQPRPRPAINGKRFVATPTKPAKLWNAAIEKACKAWLAERPAAPGWLEEPLRAEIAFWFPTDKRERWGRPFDHVPDLDNLMKPMLDSAKRAGLITDDRLVAGVQAVKLWARAGGAMMTLRPWAEPGGLLAPDADDLGAWAAPDIEAAACTDSRIS